MRFTQNTVIQHQKTTCIYKEKKVRDEPLMRGSAGDGDRVRSSWR
jgi:hypothetical protein